jgi:uncharacterized protein
VTTRVVVTGDTHLPRFGRALPADLARACESADRILHVGDITEPFVLDLLEGFAPTEAVAGNNDGPQLTARLGHDRIVVVEDARIAMTHGHLGSGRTTPERAWRRFVDGEPSVHAIAFGHSHQPMVERRDARWILNPGSPTDRRREPAFSFLRLVIDGAEITPELIRYAPRRP